MGNGPPLTGYQYINCTHTEIVSEIIEHDKPARVGERDVRCVCRRVCAVRMERVFKGCPLGWVCACVCVCV